ncbi:MAG: bifunctional transaldolase/phosoglucose isomerase [Gammaproteobacteria bacterium]|jgi:transaldolase/glucose-6-phosphate isomerase|nr:bifunctional transaldolase/phosoglucose isomerase [Gammaproteobacteria bacterium]
MNPLQALHAQGQSIWLDYIRRKLLTGGELSRLIDEDSVTGMTSNPAIFQKAITGSTDYSEAIAALARDESLDAKTLFERLAIEDIRMAADALRGVYEKTSGRDGFVSMEVSPRLANDTDATCVEARRLWNAVGRPNLMIKVPATHEGLPAIETLIGEGINVNATLLFSVEMYRQVAERYLRGLEALVANGGDPARVSSVASFFVSRVDTAVDNAIAERHSGSSGAGGASGLRAPLGRIAIANAKIAYRDSRRIFSGNQWRILESQGAGAQRLLWASTGVKNPAYRDVVYVEELIGPDTVNTMPPATLDAFRDHGEVRVTLEEDVEQAQADVDSLETFGIDLGAITDTLLEDGVRLFVEAFDKLLAAVDAARRDALKPRIDRQVCQLPAELESDLERAFDGWDEEQKICRLWRRDAWLWTGNDEARWMDWLDITSEQIHHLGDLRRLRHMAEGKYFTHAVLLGMGGSSLAPETFARTFGPAPDHPELLIVDSTDPAQIRTVESGIDIARTVFIVSSKSGSTLEPNILYAYFMARAIEALGEKQAPNHFYAITDPGSSLEAVAREKGFRKTFHGKPGIGGRYSALSNFGMVPAALIGMDVTKLLDDTEEMVEACAGCVSRHDNPCLQLGLIMGLSARRGRDKLTIIASPGVAAFGAWLEQLVAESTGKQGKGLIPVDTESLAAPSAYGEDRLFAYLRLDDGPDSKQDAAVDALARAGHPVVRIHIGNRHEMGQEIFRWEIATAVAGSVLGINPFDQPDVEASKIETRKLTEAYARSGSLPEQEPIAKSDGIFLYTDATNAEALANAAGGDDSPDALLAAHLARIGTGDYFALLAYMNRLDEIHERELQAIRHSVRERTRAATCLGYGPRFLHSTGQAHKGGPNSGVFLQLTCDDAEDLPVPGYAYGFGVVKAAQARGDFEVLAERGRRLLRIHLPADTHRGLTQLRAMVERALSA